MEVYIHGSWPKDLRSFEDYLGFFYCWRNYHASQLTAVELPALHRFLFLIINNIITPKATIKTNVERFAVFLLRSVLEQNPRVNIPHIMLAHMHKAENAYKFTFPYAHIITCILLDEGIDLNMPIWGTPTNESEFAYPENLFNQLDKTGWVSNDDSVYIPGPFHRNAYLFRPNAKVNQYEEIGNEPLHVPGGRGEGQGIDANVSAYIDGKFDALNKRIDEKFEKLEGNVNKRIDERFDKLDESVAKNKEDLQRFWSTVDLNFKKLLAKGSSSGGGDDDDE